MALPYGARRAATTANTRRQALLKYDHDIAKVADKLRALGDHWVGEFAKSYLAINNKAYLPNIVTQIIADARKEQDR